MSSAEDKSDTSDQLWQQFNVADECLASNANAMLVVNESDSRSARALAKLSHFNAGRWVYDENKQQWHCHALTDYSVLPDVVVLAMVDTSLFDLYAASLKRQFANVEVLNFRQIKQSGLSCQSLDAVNVATALVSEKSVMGKQIDLSVKEPQTVLVMSVNVQKSASVCVVSKIKGNTHVSDH